MKPVQQESPMRKVCLFAAAAAFFLSAVGVWAASTTYVTIETIQLTKTAGNTIDTIQLTKTAGNLPTEVFKDYSKVFD
jgi:hypothetical protein